MKLLIIFYFTAHHFHNSTSPRHIFSISHSLTPPLMPCDPRHTGTSLHLHLEVWIGAEQQGRQRNVWISHPCNPRFSARPPACSSTTSSATTQTTNHTILLRFRRVFAFSTKSLFPHLQHLHLASGTHQTLHAAPPHPVCELCVVAVHSEAWLSRAVQSPLILPRSITRSFLRATT